MDYLEEQLELVSVTRQFAKWRYADKDDHLLLACSNCGCGIIKTKYARDIVGSLGFRYCPYCGCRMSNSSKILED